LESFAVGLQKSKLLLGRLGLGLCKFGNSPLLDTCLMKAPFQTLTLTAKLRGFLLHAPDPLLMPLPPVSQLCIHSGGLERSHLDVLVGFTKLLSQACDLCLKRFISRLSGQVLSPGSSIFTRCLLKLRPRC